MLQEEQNLDIYEITNEDSKRISVVKVWLTIMVVFIHVYNVTNDFVSGNATFIIPAWLEVLKYVISKCISRCAVPAFFLISSILLYRKPFIWKDNIKKKIKSLMIPYVILNTFWILFYLVVQNVPVLNGYFSNTDNVVKTWGIVEWIDAYLGFKDEYPLLYPLWFLRDLFVLNILAKIIKKIIDTIPYISIVVLLAGWLFLDSTHVFFINIQAICFWGFGCFIVNKRVRLREADKVKPVYLWILYITALLVDVATRMYSWNLPLHRIMIIIAIVFWFVCMTRFKNGKVEKFFMFIASYSFSIYLFHEMSLTILNKLCVKLLPTTPVFQLAEYICNPFVIICCCMILSMILERWFPRMYGTITGSRTK